MYLRCKIFPCTFLKTYTSIIDETKDRKEERLQCVSFKRSINEHNKQLELNNQSTFPGFADSDKAQNYIELEEKENSGSENNFFKSTEDYLFATKSIRRPLRKGGSATNELVFKMKSLQEKVKYVKEQNLINFKKSDRNVRYGDSCPRSNIVRQLKILSQFDS